MRIFNEISFDNIRGDVFGGVTAAVIALPMALAFGVASGAGPAAGLYGAVLIGLFAALFGSTPTLISEPTGPMTVVMTAVIINLIAADPANGLAMAFTVVMMAGLIQMAFGLLKLGHYVTMMPYTVVSGFMTGIGLILIILQIGPFLGQQPPTGGVIGTLSSIPTLLANIKIQETGLAIATLLILIFFPKNLQRYMPPQLLALIAGSLIALIFIASGLDIRQIGEIPTGLPSFHMPVFSSTQWLLMVTNAILLAALGSIDALLTSVIAENLTQKESDPNKELIGQGIGNLASGMFGGIAGAGATMGTVVNIKTGATTALSGIVRALLLLIVVLWLTSLTEQIPLAVLAGIAFKVGMDIIDWSFLKRAHRVSTKAAWIMYGVITLTVFVDLMAAVAIGVFIANVLTIERLSKLHSESVKTIDDPNEPGLRHDEQYRLEEADGKILVFALGGPLIFGVAKAISRQYAVLEGHEVLIVDFTEVPMLGVSSSLALESMILEDISKDKPVFFVGMNRSVKKRMNDLDILKKLPKSHIVAKRHDAISKASDLINENKSAA